jgi:hypothetical protein
MSTAMFPLGMKSYNNSLPQGGYKPWKINNPIGITSGNIIPLKNKDYSNDTIYKPGSSRPLKIYRSGISFDTNRQTKSFSTKHNIGKLIDQPGRNIITSSPNNIMNKCITCNGVKNIVNYYPNLNYLTENPTTNTTSTFCCNAEQKARNRVKSANTNLNKNYYTTLQQYRQGRCNTYNQKSYNFTDNNGNYSSNCIPNITATSQNVNTIACKKVYYNPNNKHFAIQGAVDSSTKIMDASVRTQRIFEHNNK